MYSAFQASPSRLRRPRASLGLAANTVTDQAGSAAHAALYRETWSSLVAGCGDRHAFRNGGSQKAQRGMLPTRSIFAHKDREMAKEGSSGSTPVQKSGSTTNFQTTVRNTGSTENFQLVVSPPPPAPAPAAPAPAPAPTSQTGSGSSGK